MVNSAVNVEIHWHNHDINGFVGTQNGNNPSTVRSGF